MEATFAEYEEWSEDPIPESVIQSYNKALQQLEKYKPYAESQEDSFHQNPTIGGLS